MGPDPALLKAYQGVNEIIVTLLMNFVALHFVGFMVRGPMIEPGAPYPYSHEVGPQLFLPIILPQTAAHAGVLVGVGHCPGHVRHLSARRRRFHFGRSGPQSAGGAVCRHLGRTAYRRQLPRCGRDRGLAGIFEVLGHRYRLFHAFSQGYGYDGIVIAFLAGLSPLFAIVSALFIAGLRSGAAMMQRSVGVETTVVEAIQGLVMGEFSPSAIALAHLPGLSTGGRSNAALAAEGREARR